MNNLQKTILAGCVGAFIMGGGTSYAAEAKDIQEFSLDAMYVTATKYEKNDLSIPAMTEVFDKEKIASMNANTVFDVISNIPGFVINESPTGNASPGIRGITKHLGVLVNGVPLATENTYHLFALSTTGVNRIEVIKGGAAVLYGSNAATGVINIITEKEGDNKVAISVGNHGKRVATASVGNEKFSVNASRTSEKDIGLIYDSNVQYFRDRLKNNSYNINFNPDQHVNVMFMHSDSESHCYTKVKATGKPSTTMTNEQDYNVLQATYNNKNLRATMHYQNRKWDCDQGKGPSISKGDNYGLEIQDQWNLGKTDLTLGGSFEAIKAKNLSGGKWVNKDRNHGSVFFMTETHVSPKTDVLIGAREAFTGDSGNAFCPQLQVLQKVTKDSSAYININKSLFEPALSQRFGFTATTAPNPDLRPEKGWTYEAGWKKKVADNGLVKLDVYHMELTDRIYSAKLTDGTGRTSYFNAAKYKNTGVELSYEWRAPKGLSYGAGISYSNPRQIAKPGEKWADTENRLGIHGELGYNLGKASMNLFANYAGARSVDVGHMISVDFNASYKMTKKDKLSLKVNNILDRQDSRDNRSNANMVLPERSWVVTYERSF